MKKLILSLILIPFLANAQNEMPISDQAIQSKFLTIVKDVEVENMLGKTSEFNKCRVINKFEPNDPNRDQKLKDATDCFRKELAKKKDPKALQELAEALKLENYGLIKSKNVSEITEYLSKKMHKSLTGRDPDDKDPKDLKWENTKIVDQKVFIDMYTNQLMKSALLEVSRFCFENLELDAVKKTGNNFSSYWFPNPPVMKFKPDPKDATKKIPDISNLNDTGATTFFDMQQIDMTKRDDVLKQIQAGITKSDATAQNYKDFLGYCQGSIKLLCEVFRKDSAALSDASKDVTTKSSVMSKGANACLTMDKLQGIRKTMANTKKVTDQFEEMGEKQGEVALQMLRNPQIYQRGKCANEESLDELTSYSSADMLNQDGVDDGLSDLETKCKTNSQADGCTDFLKIGDSLDKAISNVESEMNFKREIEVATVKEIYNKPEELENYLKDHGHFELLNQLKDKTFKPEDIEAELKKVYDARKVAEIEALRTKVGKRQVSKKESTDLDNNGLKASRIGDNIKQTKEERARLAQVVMFNNIITSQLELKDQQDNVVGRNVTGWKKELEGMGNSYDDTIFEGIKSDAAANGSTKDDISISGGGIIDSILGKAKEP